MWRAFVSFLSVVLLCALAACNDSSNEDNSRILSAYQNNDEGVWVTGSGVVSKVFGDEELAGVTTQRFHVDLGNDFTVLVSYQIPGLLRLPITVNSEVSFAGVYEWQPAGGMVTVSNIGADSTDHWVLLNDRKYY
jgi:hypothetical protein